MKRVASLLTAASMLAVAPAHAIMVGSPPENLHENAPLTASQLDCVQDNSFEVSLVDVQANDSLEAWGSLGADCTLAAPGRARLGLPHPPPRHGQLPCTVMLSM